MGLGLALLGRSLGRADWVVLGLSGALLHVWNHALFKALLFFSAGSVIHATHTRDIDHLGGLAKTMPRTALGFLVGAVAICGLPPAALAPVLAGGVAAWAPELGNAGPQLASLAPLEWITVMGVVLIAGIALAGAALRVHLRHSVVRRDVTWGCGYVAPTARMQ